MIRLCKKSIQSYTWHLVIKLFFQVLLPCVTILSIKIVRLILSELNRMMSEHIFIWYAIFCLSSWNFNCGKNFSTLYHLMIKSGHILASSRKQINDSKFVNSKVKFMSFPNSNFVVAIQWIVRHKLNVNPIMYAMEIKNRKEIILNRNWEGFFALIPWTGMIPNSCAAAKIVPTASWNVPS